MRTGENTLLFHYFHGDRVAEVEGSIVEETPTFFRVRREDRSEMLLGKVWVVEVVEAP